ncbi:MAG: peptide deformylase [Spirochaetes bacterium]|nr:peptide deformylase [Spirochaetota bacterium]
MALREVKKYPDTVLRKQAAPVDTIDDGVHAIIQDMFDTMEDEFGVGLAAPQIGISKRIITVSINEKGFEHLSLINPEIVHASKETAVSEEGCLSVPRINAEVERPRKVVVHGTTRNGSAVEIDASGLLARVLQHEIDHLNGVLFIDRLSEKEKKRTKPEIDDMTHRPSPSSR